MMSPFSASAKTLAIVAGLALVTATVVLWVTSAQSGRMMRENAELSYQMSLLASAPSWTEEQSRETLEKSLRSAHPELTEKARISFAAPCWAIVRQDNRYMLLKWLASPEGYAWSLLDQAEALR